MAAKVQSATTIARPVEDVFQFVLDLDQHPTDPGVESVVKSPKGPTGPGTTFRFTHANGRQTTMRFTAVEPSRRIGFEAIVRPLMPVGDMNFAPKDGHTRRPVQRLARIKAALEAPPLEASDRAVGSIPFRSLRHDDRPNAEGR